MRVPALDISGPDQPVTSSGTILTSRDRHQQPGDGSLFDVVGVAGYIFRLGISPDCARVPGVLPCGTNEVVAYHLWIRVRFGWVGAEVVSNQLFTVSIE